MSITEANRAHIIMNTDWQAFLQGYGAQLDATGISGFAESTPSPKAALLVDASPMAVVEITGDDATSFLQSQFCNNMEAVSADQGQLSGYCTPKGRLLAFFSVIAVAGGYRLLLPQTMVEVFVKRLQMYVLRAKVSVAVRDDLVCVGLVAGASGQLELAEKVLPASKLAVVSQGELQTVRWHDDYIAGAGRQRYLCVATPAVMAELWEQLVPTAVCAAFDRWRLADISAGVPRLIEQTREAFVPQMVNLHLIDALSFTKGCYPGQEIVARMQYLGKLKRHMRRYHVNGENVPPPGTAVHAGDDSGAGQVVDAVRGPHGVELLAVVKTGADTGLTVADQPMQAKDLPYQLPTLSAMDADVEPADS